MELLIHCLFFIGIRELKLRQIEVNIIFVWSRQNSDEMAISCVQACVCFLAYFFFRELYLS